MQPTSIDYSCELISELRILASTGASVAELLRTILRRLPSNQQQGKIHLVMYFREAFSVSLAAASPIGGWEKDGTGEITDIRIEEFLRPEIEKTRESWQNRPPL